MEKVNCAVVTGANSGVGLGICDRLLYDNINLKLCMVCRNKLKADQAIEYLLKKHPGANIHLVQADVGSLASISEAATKICELYSHVDALFLNAGTMPDPKVNYGAVMKTFLKPSKMIHRFTTGDELLMISDGTTEEGFKLTFATNVLGHFSLVQQLSSVLGGSTPSQIIWTSSRSAAASKVFSLDDIQHCIGIDPYASSKYLIDHISLAMNQRLRQQNISSQTACPGLVRSGMSLSILPYWVWFILFPIMKLLRFAVPSFTIEAHNGSEAMIYLTMQDPACLDPLDKYYSCCDAFGYPYTSATKMDISVEKANSAYGQLEELLDQKKKK